ncbi:ABC transporter ATP-binding protein [Bisgaard Taxon 45]|uniref:ABC transporter ATP-binding protein n=1 Tax=Bisgaard Taxon 45 TaxID=304289 RepID=A0ABT9KBM3_9PAST|nr:ABC transporter ATP-binding protein [Bisgaard Taxon 45]
MNEKELKRYATGHMRLSSSLLMLNILFDLVAQILLVCSIAELFADKVSHRHFYMFLFGMLLCFLLKALFHYLATKVAHDNAYNQLTTLRLAIITQLKKLNLGFFKQHNTAELTTIIQHDVEQVESYLAHGLPEIMSAALLPLLTFITMLFVDYRLAFAMLVGIPLMYLVKILSANIIQQRFQRYFARERQMREDMMEYVKNIAVLKAFAKEETFSEKTLSSARSYTDDLKKMMGGITFPMGLIDIFMEIGMVFVIISGTILLLNQAISISQFILAIVLSSLFISAISKTATLHHFSIVFAEKLKSIAKVLCVPLPKTKCDDELMPGDIKLSQVNFQYPGDGFALKNINLTFKQQSLNAVIGASGCGKSTLAHLIMGFWDIDSGDLTIAGKPISAYSMESLSRLIGSVEQEVVLFNLSLFDNIAIGKAGATETEVITAAKKAQCHDFISHLPQGYHSKVGEMGVKLSGGEKQRIAIARAILKNAPILILDEATAALDSENEQLINAAINALCKDKTVICIAHHLNRIQHAQQTTLMDKGCVIDSGSHLELLARCRVYRQMVEAQNKVDHWKLKEMKHV